MLTPRAADRQLNQRSSLFSIERKEMGEGIQNPIVGGLSNGLLE